MVLPLCVHTQSACIVLHHTLYTASGPCTAHYWPCIGKGVRGALAQCAGMRWYARAGVDGSVGGWVGGWAPQSGVEGPWQGALVRMHAWLGRGASLHARSVLTDRHDAPRLA